MALVILESTKTPEYLNVLTLSQAFLLKLL